MNFNRMKFHFTHNTMRFKLNVSSSSFVEFSSRVGLSPATSFAAKVRRGAMCWKNRKDFQEFLDSLSILPIWWFFEVLFCCCFQNFRALEKQETKRRRCEIDSGPERESKPRMTVGKDDGEEEEKNEKEVFLIFSYTLLVSVFCCCPVSFVSMVLLPISSLSLCMYGPVYTFNRYCEGLNSLFFFCYI